MRITDLDLEELVKELQKLKDQRFTGTIQIEIENGEFSEPVEIRKERKEAA